MLKPKSRWIVRETNQEQVERLVSELNITPLVASLLVNRGLETPESARSFLFDKNQDFHDPFLMSDMDVAVARIKEAIEKQEPILVFGDYDADGVTSTSVMMITLSELGANVTFYIPNRFTEGYGPNENAFRQAADQGFRLIITVDTGIAAIHEAKIAKELGIDLIITDHHEPGKELPEALAIVHPKLANSQYPFRDLAGVGVAFKLSHALYGYVPEHLLELTAIGTVADLVSLKDENRLIVKKGLKRLQKTENLGLLALMKKASVKPSSIDEETIGYVLAPRINAIGRLESAEPAVHLILTDNQEEADVLADEIEQLNKERQSLVSEITEQAVKEVEEHFPIKDNAVLVIGGVGWNAGVIGIVASKLVEKYYRPTIVLSFDEEKGIAKGSARSIVGFDLFQNLSTCRDILPHFGGHPMAAGMTLKLSDVTELRDRLNSLASEQLKEEDFIPVTKIDCEVDLSDIQIGAIEEMKLLSPYGMDNPKPRVLVHHVGISQMRRIGSDQSHLKLTLDENGNGLDGVGFGLGHLYEGISPLSKISVTGELSINEWNNIRKPQIFLQDISVSSWQLFDFRGLKRVHKLSDSIPREKTKWVLFNQENKNKLQKYVGNDLVIVDSKEAAVELRLDAFNVVLVDMPPNKETLERLLGGKKPERIYVHFYQEKSDFFSTMPTREHFKWYYAFLLKKAPFDLNRYGDELAKYRGWTRDTIDFMSEVFSELEFVKIDNGFIFLNQNKIKRDLSESLVYRKKQAHYALENDLLFSSFQELHHWFDEMIQGQMKFEEAIKEWI
ncbi:single-stranded-DNA-specific exonuclease RecJ [Bacillus massilinigeriensis]|uniref:single-stranded-DNA-specific exonuclease RecJ n=1 Tax=Bacillus massilionigeriensis TaxID=1805475 RepID=UPI00096B3DD0|nr:single-stranded-DNA-specific exonuclease RecJ [Bacillus massilionigeriensis]